MTIDISKMKALAKRLSWIAKQEAYGFNPDDYVEAADAIDSLLSELEAREADRLDAEPTMEMIRAGLSIQWPALYKEALFFEHDGPILRAATESRIRTMKLQYKAMVATALAQREEGK